MRSLIRTILILSTVHLSAVSGEVVTQGTPETPARGSSAGSALSPPELGYSNLQGRRESVPRVSEYTFYRTQERLPYQLGSSRGAAHDREIQVIPAKETEATKIAAISRDLQVMLHILQKRFVGYESAYENYNRLFADLGQIFVADDGATKAMYIEGFGALFFMEVNFPVKPLPASEKQDSKAAEDATDQTWKRAEQELFSPEGYDSGHLTSNIAFDAQMVENLKTELISRLKHASNIRSMTSDDWVIVTVYGGSPNILAVDYSGYMVTAAGGSPNIPGAIAYQPSALTIRAKKSDIDAFGQGKLGVAQFREKVEVFTYTPFGRAILTGSQSTGLGVAEPVRDATRPAEQPKAAESPGTITGTETVPYRR